MDRVRRKIISDKSPLRRNPSKDQNKLSSKKGKDVQSTSKELIKGQSNFVLLANKENMVISNKANSKQTNLKSINNDDVCEMKSENRITYSNSGSIDSLDYGINDLSIEASNKDMKSVVYNKGHQSIHARSMNGNRKKNCVNNKICERRLVTPPDRLNVKCCSNSSGNLVGDCSCQGDGELTKCVSNPDMETYANGEPVEKVHFLTQSWHEDFLEDPEEWGSLKKYDSFEVLEDWCVRSMHKSDSTGLGDKNCFSDLIEYVEENGMDICGALKEEDDIHEHVHGRKTDQLDNFEMLEKWCEIKEGEIEIGESSSSHKHSSQSQQTGKHDLEKHTAMDLKKQLHNQLNGDSSASMTDNLIEKQVDSRNHTVTNCETDSTDCDESLSEDSIDNCFNRELTHSELNDRKHVTGDKAIVRPILLAVSQNGTSSASLSPSTSKSSIDNIQPLNKTSPDCSLSPVVFKENNFVPSPRPVRKFNNIRKQKLDVPNRSNQDTSALNGKVVTNDEGEKINQSEVKANASISINKCKKGNAKTGKIVFEEPNFALGVLNSSHLKMDHSLISNSGDGDSWSHESVTSDITDDFSWSDVDSMREDNVIRSDARALAHNMAKITYKSGYPMKSRSSSDCESKPSKNHSKSGVRPIIRTPRKITGVKFDSPSSSKSPESFKSSLSQNGARSTITDEKRSEKTRNKLRKAVSTPSLGLSDYSNQNPPLPPFRPGTPKHFGRSGQSCMDVRYQQPPGVSFENDDWDFDVSNKAHADLIYKKKQQIQALSVEKKKLQLKLTSKQQRKLVPMKSSPITSPGSPQTFARFNDIQALSLAGAELEAVTNLYTLCNGQQQAKIIKKATAPMIVKLAPDVKEASRVRWACEKDLVEDISGGNHVPHTETNLIPTKSILKSRDPSSPFQYADVPYSPVVVRKLAKKSNCLEEIDPSKQ